MIKEYGLTEIPHWKIHGRTSSRPDALTLFWTASGFEVNVTGSELWVEVEGDYEVMEPWISVRVNGAWVSRQMVNKGKQWVCLFRRRSPETVKNVRLWKDIQPMPGDTAHLLRIHGFRGDGEFLPVPDRPLKLEFVGDSLTSGEGTIGALEEKDWVSMLFAAENNYAVMTGDKLNADVRLLSQCGWGVISGANNDPHTIMPPYYGQICGMLKGERNQKLGALEPNDFSAWQPDAVIINLGSNDCGAFSSPAWTDPDTGETFKLRRREDESFEPEDLRRFQNGVIAFLQDLRKKNANAWLLWTCGMIKIDLAPAIAEAVEEYCRESGDRRASFFELTDAVEYRGPRSHPGSKAHAVAAEELSGELRRLLL